MCVFLVAQASHLDKTVESLASRTLKMMSTFVKSAGDIFAKPTRFFLLQMGELIKDVNLFSRELRAFVFLPHVICRRAVGFVFLNLQ